MRRLRASPQNLLSLAAALIAAVWGVLVASAPLGGRETALDRIEAPLVDLRFLISGQRPAPAGLVIVAIDDDTVRASGSYPLPRKELARLVEAVAAKRPKALGLDILLLDRGPPEGDAALAAAPCARRRR